MGQTVQVNGIDSGSEAIITQLPTRVGLSRVGAKAQMLDPFAQDRLAHEGFAPGQVEEQQLFMGWSLLALRYAREAELCGQPSVAGVPPSGL